MNEKELRNLHFIAMIEVAGCAPESALSKPLSPIMLKFAELIVQECGKWFNDRLVVNPDYGLEHRIERNRAVVGIMKEFNQHFG
jgi:hypothetical protein